MLVRVKTLKVDLNTMRQEIVEEEIDVPEAESTLTNTQEATAEG
jgi:hypothetical protein